MMGPKFNNRVPIAQPYVLYGAGSLFSQCSEQIVQMLGGPPAHVIDAGRAARGETVQAKVCQGPGALHGLPRELPVVIGTRNHLEIAGKLMAMGFQNLYMVQYEPAAVRAEKIIPYQRPTSTDAVTLESLSLAGRLALITGSTRGIGLEIAVALSGLGADIRLHGRTAESVQDGLRKFSERTGKSGKGYVADFSSLDGTDRLEAQLNQEGIPVDILYNNAGISMETTGGHLATEFSSYDDCLRVNFRSTVALTSRILPQMMANGFGRVVFLTSSLRHQADRIAYVCSKSAVVSYASEIASAIADSDIRISTVDPGWVSSDMGGPLAPAATSSVIPGALIGALPLPFRNNIWVTAQDYAGLSLSEAVDKACIDGFLQNA
jgi:short-subunit dehydrogenase